MAVSHVVSVDKAGAAMTVALAPYVTLTNVTRITASSCTGTAEFSDAVSLPTADSTASPEKSWW
ncbi:hypothetical protein JG687_00001087 [Phytophthora cactorum]|uniref:Uncharacterized protein n=1 Tax=Phytophthora cactorum TaxID=29920 RepID=A0A329SNG8_9STRA|nr:hypothetical protein JG687_00001087 [Phytophthora cactorum]RAW38250.1 hypothetical protein PC110_g5535 [Phytophthora cactorum]